MKLSTAALRESRAKKQDEMRSLLGKGEQMTADDRKRFDTLEEETRNISADMRRVQLLEEAERHEIAEPVEGRNGDLHDIERRYSVSKAISELLEGKLTGAEAEYNSERRGKRPGSISVPVATLLGDRRALTKTTPAGGPGSNLVATSLGPQIDALRPALMVEAMGATILSGLTDNVDLPRLKASGSAGWVAEHTDATGTDPQFDKVSMTPKTVSALYEVSRRMLLQAANLEGILRADLGFLLAQAIDSAAIQGGGSNQPVGIIGNSSVPVVALGTNGLAMTIDTPADLIGTVMGANAPMGASGFLTNTKVRTAAMKLKDSQNRPFGVPAVFKDEPVMFSNQVPSTLTKGTSTGVCSAVIYSPAWSELVIGYWSTVEIMVNPYADSVAKKGGAFVHAFLDTDVALRHVESFAVCKDVLA